MQTISSVNPVFPHKVSPLKNKLIFLIFLICLLSTQVLPANWFIIVTNSTCQISDHMNSSSKLSSFSFSNLHIDAKCLYQTYTSLKRNAFPVLPTKAREIRQLRDAKWLPHFSQQQMLLPSRNFTNFLGIDTIFTK